MVLHGADYSGYSNAQLDQVYADAYAGYNATTGVAKLSYSQTVNDVAQEILNRLQTPGSFATSLWDSFTGGAIFPQYDAIQKTVPGGFVAGQIASSSVAQSASNLEAQAGNVASNVMGTGSMIGIGVGLMALYLFTRKG